MGVAAAVVGVELAEGWRVSGVGVDRSEDSAFKSEDCRDFEAVRLDACSPDFTGVVGTPLLEADRALVVTDEERLSLLFSPPKRDNLSDTSEAQLSLSLISDEANLREARGEAGGGRLLHT